MTGFGRTRLKKEERTLWQPELSQSFGGSRPVFPRWLPRVRVFRVPLGSPYQTYGVDVAVVPTMVMPSWQPMQVWADTAVCMAVPEVVFGRMAVPDILKVVKLVAEWQRSQAVVPTGMCVVLEGVFGLPPQDEMGITMG
jgi:hypothetical protein